MSTMDNQNEKNGPGDIISEFAQKHRKPIFITAASIVLLLIIFIAALSFVDMLKGKDISAVEDFNSRYEVLRPSINEEYSAVELEELLAEIESFAHKKSGYAGGRAWSIIASIHSEKSEWPAAENAWVSAANAAKKTYLIPLAWFNAAVAAEEQGKTEQALEYYGHCIDAADDFPGAARAQFAIGRLKESINENAEAIEAYRAVISGWPYDRVWTNLAHSRIIALENEVF